MTALLVKNTFVPNGRVAGRCKRKAEAKQLTDEPLVTFSLAEIGELGNFKQAIKVC